MSNDEKPIDTVDEGTLQNAETEIPESTENEITDNSHQVQPPKDPTFFQKLKGLYKNKKKRAIGLSVIALLVVLMGLPLTRYAILGLVIKRDISVKVTDVQTSMPISGVEVSVHGISAKTDGQGNATIKGVRVGKTKLTARKKYYKDFLSDITITLAKVKSLGEFKLEATGRQIPLHVTNKITGQNIAGAKIKASDTEAQTDESGQATLVLPPNQTTVAGIVSAPGYNDQSVQVTINESAVKENTFPITPSGKVYFLSKQSGKIDVVKTDLDGSNRQTVLAGTGQEEDTNTVLLASRDWKYLTLQSRRDGDKAKLYLIDTSSDKLTDMDSSDATFVPIGWHDHSFIYQDSRAGALIWQSKATALKSFNAENLQLNTLDETNAEGSGNSDYATESIDQVYILRDTIAYTKHWNASYYSVYRLAGKRMGIYSVNPNGMNKQTLKDFDAGNNGYISAILPKPDEIYFSVTTTNTSFYEYATGSIKESPTLNNNIFNKFYFTYLASPSGQNTLWYEPRDGKNTLFTGTADGSNPKEIASLSEYTPYGWYTDNYLLVSKGGSELFVLPANGPGEKGQILKVSDYHKPTTNFQGYGYGYGGI